ncbi:MAG: hypothetical protein M3373_06910 [Gemmatimonadota bacterium]|nr:hypothetical protein [Gemmatimonadota bacterium]
MTRHILTRAIGAAALMAALVACGDESTSPSDSDLEALESVDVAAVTADAFAEDVSLMNTQEGALGQPTVDAGRTGAWENNCTYNATTGRFDCPGISRNGLTIARSFQLLDANGQPQSAYDAITTASASFLTTVAGAVARNGFNATFSRQRNINVTGLAGQETTHTFNGSGSNASTQSQHIGGGISRSYSMTIATTITNVVIPVPRVEGSWPLSGTITRQVAFSRDGARGQGRSGSRTVTITFNGTQFVPMTVGEHTFTLDLATGEVTVVE